MNKVADSKQRRPINESAFRKRDRWLYAMPFIIILLAISINIQKPTDQMATAQSALGAISAQGSAYRQLVYGGTYLFAFILVVRKLGRLRAVLSGHWAYVAMLGYIASSALWSQFPMQVAIDWVHFSGFFFISVTAVMAFQRDEEFFFRVLVYVSSISIVSSLLAVAFYPSRGIAEGGRWMGFAYHPNYLGLISLVSVWANRSYLYYKKDSKIRAWSIFIIFLSFLCMYGANSMTSMVLSVGIVFGIPFMIRLAKQPGIYTVVKLVGILFAFAVVVFAVYVIAPEMAITDALFHVIGRKADLTGRTELWEIAKAAIDEKPFLGWSFDSLWSLSSKHMIRYGQFHNGYLDLLVRGGLVGLMFAIYIIVKSLYYLVRLHRVNPKLFVLLSSFFVAILVHNITEASIVTSTNLLWLLFSILYFMLSRSLVQAQKMRHG